MTCAACGADLGTLAQVGRRDVCPRCGVELRCCRQCRHFDRAAANECREPQAERVADKTRANFCEWFGPGPGPAGSVTRPGGTADAARVELDRLFRGR